MKSIAESIRGVLMKVNIRNMIDIVSHMGAIVQL